MSMRPERHFLLASLALFLCLWLSLPACAEGGALREGASFEGGTAYRTADDIYRVLNLSGSWREMGRQYGALAKDALQQFYREITSDVEARGIDLPQQLDAAKGLAAAMSGDLNALLAGMAETSGLSLDEVLLLNCGMVNLADVLLGPLPPSACSGIAAWGEFTPDGRLTFGRNWDIDRAGMLKYMQYLSVVVFNPDEGNAFANVHPLGNVYLETGINEKGLFLELNNGGYSDPMCYEERENAVSVLVSALNRCDTIDEAAAFLAEIPADMSYIIQLADSARCVSVERPTFGCRVREGDPRGLLVAYNSFVPPYPDEWTGKVAAPRDPKKDARYDNLVNLAHSEPFFGKLDPDGMMRLLDVRYQDGGAVHPGTVMQVVAMPEELCLWIRGFEYSDWQKVELGELFGLEKGA